MRALRNASFIAGIAAAIVLGVAMHSRAAFAQSVSCNTPAEKAACQSQYDELQKEIAAQQDIITKIRAQESTYQGSVTLLNAQIKQAQAQIDAKNLQVKQLGNQIAQKTQVIGQLSAQIDAGHQSLASMLRQQQELDDYTPAEVALGASDVSDFFSDVDAFLSIETGMQDLFQGIKTAKAQTEDQKAQLAAAQNATNDAKYTIQTAQQKAASSKAEQQQLLSVAKSSEAVQQQALAANQAKAAAIRAALFPLRDAGPIQFGDALIYAQAAQKATGVDAAFILAILTQESNLGANVGQCYLTDDTTGAGVGKNTGTPFTYVMNPTRDVPYFLALAQKLGFDPHHQVVSCPIASAGGWGGAMGPSQFIPSTWNGYAARIAAARGEAVANPWSAQDAIMATALYMQDLGAGAGTYTSELNAAAKYYAGAAWATAGQSYGAQVMAKVAGIQQNIDFLANNPS